MNLCRIIDINSNDDDEDDDVWQSGGFSGASGRSGVRVVVRVVPAPELVFVRAAFTRSTLPTAAWTMRPCKDSFAGCLTVRVSRPNTPLARGNIHEAHMKHT